METGAKIEEEPLSRQMLMYLKQRGQTFCRSAFVTLQLRVDFLTTISVSPP